MGVIFNGQRPEGGEWMASQATGVCCSVLVAV